MAIKYNNTHKKIRANFNRMVKQFFVYFCDRQFFIVASDFV